MPGGLIGRIMSDAAPAVQASPVHGHSAGSVRDSQLAIRLMIETIIDPPVLKGIGRYLRGRGQIKLFPPMPMDPHRWVEPFAGIQLLGASAVWHGGAGT